MTKDRGCELYYFVFYDLQFVGINFCERALEFLIGHADDTHMCHIPSLVPRPSPSFSSLTVQKTWERGWDNLSRV